MQRRRHGRLMTSTRLLLGALVLLAFISIFSMHSTISHFRSVPDSIVGKAQYFIASPTNKVLSSWKPHTGPKYHVGCDTNKWKVYVRPEWFYIFNGLEKNHNWKPLSDQINYKTDLTARRKLLAEKPAALLFCESAVERYLELPIDTLRREGCHIAAFSDDSHKYNKFSTRMMRFILDRTDALIGTYAYLMENYFSSVPLRNPPPNLIWFPHAASPTFTARLFNDDPIQKIFLSGANQQDAYPIRHWLHDTFQKEYPTIMSVYEHPGYVKHAENQSMIYAQTARAYFAGITTTMIHRRLVAKVFELPCVGMLLIVNLDLEQYMEALGMVNMVHYVGYKDSDPESMIWWAMDPLNQEKINTIRKAGFDLIREKHTTTLRVEALDQYFTTGKVPYPFPSMAREFPCPMKGFATEKACIDYFNYEIHHHRPIKDAVDVPWH